MMHSRREPPSHQRASLTLSAFCTVISKQPSMSPPAALTPAASSSR